MNDEREDRLWWQPIPHAGLAKLAAAIENPKEPNDALKELLGKPAEITDMERAARIAEGFARANLNFNTNEQEANVAAATAMAIAVEIRKLKS